MVAVFFIAVITFIITFIFRNELSQIFFTDSININEYLVNLSGTLFGLVLTAYAIFFGLVPLFNSSFKDTKAYRKINFRFFITAILSLIILITSFVSLFINKTYLTSILPFQISILTSTTILFFLLATYLYLIFNNSKVLNKN